MSKSKVKRDNFQHKPHAPVEIIDLEVPNEFYSTRDTGFWANVSTLCHEEVEARIQVIFKGYVCNEKEILYEFLYEHCFIHLEGKSKETNEAHLDVRIRRLPPSMEISDKLRIEYCCQASADPWYSNTHIKKIFHVIRDDIQKEKTIFPNRFHVNECVGHNQCCHRNCEALNGKFWIDRNTFSPNEKAVVRWKINTQTAINEARISLFRNVTLRHPKAEHPMDLNIIQKEIVSKTEKVNLSSTGISLDLPAIMSTSHKPTIWDTTKLNYYLVFQLRMAKIKTPLELHFPITIQHSFDEKHQHPKSGVITEAIHDMYDVSDNKNGKQLIQYQPQTIVVSGINLHTNEHHTLDGAKVEVHLIINEAKFYTIHFLLQGSVCVGSTWYEFLRFKTTIVKEDLQLGSHDRTIDIPFDRSEYLTPILPPSFNNEIRYECLLSSRNWTDNRLLARKIVLVDRETETLCKAEMLEEYYEEQGAIKLYMKQRAFQRGKYIMLQLEGKVSGIILSLVQDKRIRRPGLNSEGQWFKERIVCEMGSSPNRKDWPKEWSLRIPDRITPSIDVCYWNVLEIEYKVVVKVQSHDRHEHIHVIPIWIGTTDDELEPPSNELLDIFADGNETGEISKNPTKIAPGFEVIPNEHDQPWWVDRLDFDVYHPADNLTPEKKGKK
uniref:Arrestin C-terminal-like domain-containing protein n=1 Tax=Panagrolaimus superbus TaxID=310955 RepID=A0A914YS37_9BILA